MTKLYVIKGTTRDGSTVYYTGKPGETSQSRHANQAQAFTRGGSDSNAARLVEAMNKGQAIHGVSWELAEK